MGEAHNLYATISSLEKRTSSVNAGLQHILKMMSSSEPEDSSNEVDNFWYFFSCEPTVLQKLNDIVQETNTEISHLDFWESSSSAWDSGEIDGIFTESLAHLDPALGLASQSPAVPDEGSDAMLKENMLDVASDPVETIFVETSKFKEVAYTALHFLYDTVQASTWMNGTNGDIKDLSFVSSAWSGSALHFLR